MQSNKPAVGCAWLQSEVGQLQGQLQGEAKRLQGQLQQARAEEEEAQEQRHAAKLQLSKVSDPLRSLCVCTASACLTVCANMLPAHGMLTWKPASVAATYGSHFNVLNPCNSAT